MFFRNELGEVVTDDLFKRVSDAGRTVGVDGENYAVEVMGADHAEGTFDELPVAGFALAEGGLGGALGCDVDAGGDDEADLTLVVDAGRWLTRRCGGGCRRD